MGSDYHFYSTGSSVNSEITIRRAGNNALVATDDDSGTGDNFDCIAHLDYLTNYKVELRSNYGSGDMTVIIEKVPTPDPITVYFLCTENDWTPPYIRYFDLSYTDGVKTMAHFGNNVWMATIPYYSAQFWLSKDNSYNDETRTNYFSTNASTYPIDAFKNGSGTETFGKYFVGSYDPFLFLAVNASNGAAITDAATNGGKYDVTLSGRTLSKSGEWNTLTVPFALNDFTGTPLEGATVKELLTTSNLDSNGKLTLNFSSDNLTAIEAGKPYIVKWEGASGSVSNPVFEGITISSTTPTAVTSNDGKVTFVGQYSPFSIGDTNSGTFDGDINEIIMLGTGSKLGYSQNPRTLRSFRCHFYVKADGGVQGARAFVLDFGEDESTPTGIGHTEITERAGAWYTLDGRKFDGKPTAKGVYIRGGKKVVIK